MLLIKNYLLPILLIIGYQAQAFPVLDLAKEATMSLINHDKGQVHSYSYSCVPNHRPVGNYWCPRGEYSQWCSIESNYDQICLTNILSSDTLTAEVAGQTKITSSIEADLLTQLNPHRIALVNKYSELEQRLDQIDTQIKNQVTQLNADIQNYLNNQSCAKTGDFEANAQAKLNCLKSLIPILVKNNGNRILKNNIKKSLQKLIKGNQLNSVDMEDAKKQFELLNKIKSPTNAGDI